MKPIIFARISNMSYYKGVTDRDRPENGGSYVGETGMAHECFNFDAVQMEDGSEKCLGFVMPLGKNGINTQLKLENIVGCHGAGKEEFLSGVTVVWCSKACNSNSIRVVGFYKNATVFRYCQYDDGCDQYFSFLADKEDCVLVPYQKRFSDSRWYVPTSGKNNYDFGFGRSNIWYGGSETKNKKEIEYVERMINSVENYNEENWIDEGRL